MNTLPYQRAFARIRAEFVEMPGMRLTPEQVARLSGVEPAICKCVLDDLVRARFLCISTNGSYARSSDTVSTAHGSEMRTCAVPRQRGDRGMPRTVILVEARSESRSAHAVALREAGLEVIRVPDSQAARGALTRVVPRVVVAGLNPRTRHDHLELCREIRNHARTMQIPIVLTTEHMRDEDVALATDPGALVLTATEDDGAKVVAAVEGVLAAARPEPVRALPHEEQIHKRTA